MPAIVPTGPRRFSARALGCCRVSPPAAAAPVGPPPHRVGWPHRDCGRAARRFHGPALRPDRARVASESGGTDRQGTRIGRARTQRLTTAAAPVRDLVVAHPFAPPIAACDVGSGYLAELCRIGQSDPVLVRDDLKSAKVGDPPVVAHGALQVGVDDLDPRFRAAHAVRAR